MSTRPAAHPRLHPRCLALAGALLLFLACAPLRAEWTVDTQDLLTLSQSASLPPVLMRLGDGSLALLDATGGFLRLTHFLPDGTLLNSSTRDDSPWDQVTRLQAVPLGLDSLAVLLTGHDTTGDTTLHMRLLWYTAGFSRYQSVLIQNPPSEYGTAMTGTREGTVIFGGGWVLGEPPVLRPLVGRFTSGGAGWIWRDSSATAGACSAIAVDSSGTIRALVAGQDRILGLMPDGTPLQPLDFIPGTPDSLSRLVVPPDGRIAVYAGISTENQNALVFGGVPTVGPLSSAWSEVVDAGPGEADLLFLPPGRFVATRGSYTEGATRIVEVDDQLDTALVAVIPHGGRRLATANDSGFVVMGSRAARFGVDGTEYWQTDPDTLASALVRADDSSWVYLVTSDAPGNQRTHRLTRVVEHFDNDPPGAFAPLEPVNGATVPYADSASTRLTWSASVDPDPGTHVRYFLHLRVARIAHPDTLLLLEGLSDTTCSLLAIAGHSDVPAIGLRNVTWSVEAVSQGDTVSAGDPWVFSLGSSGAGEGDPALPSAYHCRLYPNPTNGAVRISLDAPSAATVRLEIVDLLGRRVHVQNASLSAGRHAFQWAADVPSGTYLLRVLDRRGTPLLVRRIVVLR